jgi:hypothetical protein
LLLVHGLLNRLLFFLFLLLFLLLLRAKLSRESRERAFLSEQLNVRAALGDTPIDDSVDVIDLGKEVKRVRDEDARLACDRVEEDVVEDGLADMCVKR